MKLNLNIAPYCSAVQALWNDTCTITVAERVKRSDGSSYFRDIPVVTDEPCFLSHRQEPVADTTDNLAAPLSQGISLFLSAAISIPAGSRIRVTHKGRTDDYKASGQPAVYTSHQVVNLELFKGWT